MLPLDSVCLQQEENNSGVCDTLTLSNIHQSSVLGSSQEKRQAGEWQNTHNWDADLAQVEHSWESKVWGGSPLPDHRQRWLGTLKAWVCTGWSLPLVETAENTKIQSYVWAQREGGWGGAWHGGFIDMKWPYLKHDNTDLLDALNNGLWGPCNSYGTLRWVGQHVSCYLYLSSGWLQTQTHRGDMSRWKVQGQTDWCCSLWHEDI